MTAPATRAKPTVLVTGAAGHLASIVVEKLAPHFELVGVDPRKLPPGRKFPGEFKQVDYHKRQMAEVFRGRDFHALVHLGRVPVTSRARRSVRYNLNVLGTRNLLELVAKHEVPNVVVFSTFHVYGAHQHNHLHMTEDDPLRASQIFPELVDAVEMDHACTSFMLKHPEVRTVVLRPVNVIGPGIQNQITQWLRQKLVPVVLGYDPMIQFVHEKDVAEALWLSLHSKKHGVYNLAGEGVVPYTRAIELVGSRPLPIPHVLGYPAFAVLKRFGWRYPRHLIDYFRFPVIISDKAFRADFGYKPGVSTLDALTSLRLEPSSEPPRASESRPGAEA